jgi:RNA polymerase sigma-70 factor (ECF subfamily)
MRKRDIMAEDNRLNLDYFVRESGSRDVSHFREELYKVCLTSTVQFGIRPATDFAEDLTQDTILRILEGRFGSYVPKGTKNYWGWTKTVIRNSMIDNLRRKKVKNTLIDAGEISEKMLCFVLTHLTDPRPSPLDGILNTLHSQELRAILNQLSEELKVAVELRDFEELTYTEIKNRLDIPEGTVKSRIRRGREEFKKHLVRKRLFTASYH